MIRAFVNAASKLLKKTEPEIGAARVKRHLDGD